MFIHHVEEKFLSNSTVATADPKYRSGAVNFLHPE